MSEPRAQRTLVKSPPELWAEISDVSTLARRLGELGEIRITRLEAETTVAWEGDRARGTVELEPSGWGTKVTITAEAVAAPEVEQEVEVVEAEVVSEAAEEVAEAEPEPVAAAEPPAPAPQPEPKPVAVEAPAAPAPQLEPVAVAEPPAPSPEPKRGFFARLFGRRAATAMRQPQRTPVVVAPEPEPDPAPVVVARDTVPVAVVEAEPLAVAEPEPVAVAEISEPVIEDEITAAATATAPRTMDPAELEAVLVGVLDDLGSAHHRPFSRG